MSRSSKRLNNAFVVSQLALSLVLLIGAALLLQSFRNLLAVNPGFKPASVLMAHLSLPEKEYSSKARIKNFYDSLLQQVRSLPGVQAAELCHVVPFSGDGWGGPFTVEGHEPGPGESAKVAWLRSTSPGYFSAMGMPILRGRPFQASDTEASLPVAIIDEKLASMYWPNQDPTEKRLRIGGDSPWLTIVGVVPNVKNRKLNEEVMPYVYRPDAQWVRGEQMLVVRTTNDPESIVPAIRHQLAVLDASLPLSQVMTIEHAMARSLVTTKLTNLLLATFALVALVLAVIGTYGVISLNVGSRTNEFGIRLALGAQTSNVLRLVLGQGLKLGVTALLLGLAVAFALTRLMTQLLFGLTATDLRTFVAVGALLLAVALFACYFPARRATKVDPLVALRNE
jgi:predicted permease